MARITIVDDLCTGCGLCVASCADVFEIGDDNIAKVKADSCESCDLNQIAADCPTEAIKIEG